MRKFLRTTLLLLVICSMANAQSKKWIENVKLTGYGIARYTYNDRSDAKSNTFELRMARFSLDGRAFNDFYWKAQIQFNGNTSTLGSSPKVVDLFVEWQKYEYLKIKFGQFKNPFTFENPMNPIDQGFRSYAQNVSKLAAFSDRAGTHSSNGRDIGLQLQGDFLKNSNGRNLMHYQIGVFNGQGINVSDVDQQKNIIGGMWVMPVKGMRIGAFGWTGSYARKGFWNDGEQPNPDNGTNKAKVRKLQQRRYAFSAEYLVDDWTFRSEYIHSTGKAFSKALVNTDDESASDCNISSNGDKAQGVYALVIAPIIKNKLHAKARYDMYEPDGRVDKMCTNYDLGLDYMWGKNIKISGTYTFVHNRAAADKSSNIVDVEVSYRF